MAEISLSEARALLEKEVIRTQTMLKALEVLEREAEVRRLLVSLEQELVDAQEDRDAAIAAANAAVAALPTRKKAADDEVAAERGRLQQELARLSSALAEVQRMRREEQEGRERASKVHNETVAQWKKDDDQLKSDLQAAYNKKRDILESEIARLVKIVEAERGALIQLRVDAKAFADRAAAAAAS
jgi:hypothetical protein